MKAWITESEAARLHRNGWDYAVAIFSPDGVLLLVTSHRGEASKDIEIAAAKSRRAKGEVGSIEVMRLGAAVVECI